MRSIIKNKKGQFESYLLVFIMIFIVALVLFFLNTFNKEFYDKFDKYFNESETYNQSEAHIVVEKLQAIEGSNIWDWVFLAIFMGLIMQIVLFSFASRINVAFFWIMVIVDIPILIVAVILSNIWQSIASNPVFAETILRFPITNTILGTYYPTVVVVILFLAMIILFGKPPKTELGG